MSHLGSFGAAVKEIVGEKDTFEFFGETFTVHDVLPPMLMLQLGASASGKIDDQEGLAALWEAMRCSLTVPERQVPPATPDGELEIIPADGSQFDRLYKLAVRNRCDLDELMRLAMSLFEAQAGRPTERQPGSSAGLPTTSPSSSTSSSPFGDSTPVVMERWDPPKLTVDQVPGMTRI